MSDTPTPTQTPNVVISNPTVRKVLRTVIDSIGGVAFIASAVDLASPDFDISAWTLSIMAGYTAARVVFGFAVDTPNTPR
jgi:hypothetical protein